jgi:hypothetical protein
VSAFVLAFHLTRLALLRAGRLAHVAAKEHPVAFGAALLMNIAAETLTALAGAQVAAFELISAL